MAFSSLVTRKVSTPNKGNRSGAQVQFIVLHHMASTSFEAVLQSWHTGRKQGSAHYAISNTGEVVGVVDESLRAWSLSSPSFDSKSIVFEIANKSVGAPWPTSAEANEATAQVVADIARRHNIPVNRDTVIGHREVFTRHKAGYATACPGGLPLDAIVARAVELLGGAAPAPAPAPAPAAAWAFNLPDRAGQIRVQKALAGRKPSRYTGPKDGVFGPATIKGIQLTIKSVGYSGPIDGVAGANTCRLIQEYAKKFGSYTGPIDSILGANSWAGFALGLERP